MPVVSRSELTKKILKNGLITGTIITGLYLWSLVKFGWYPGEDFFSNPEAVNNSSTLVFTALTVIQIIYALRLRQNLPLISLTIILFFLLENLKNFDHLNKYLNLKPLSGLQWQIIIFVGIMIFAIDELIKLLWIKPSKN